MQTAQKRNGVHYTPAPLAQFLAEQIASQFPFADSQTPPAIKVLDPACGAGELLSAFEAVFTTTFGDSRRIELHGCDTDALATKATRERLALVGGDTTIHVRKADFLKRSTAPEFDVVIANPPYVRTQVLGGVQARALATEFGLTGRVDLYQAFAAQISKVLKPGGVMGLLTSNRFLSVKSGATLRQLLSEQFDVRAVYDLGDTRLFSAAVLPAIVIAKKLPNDPAHVSVKKLDVGKKPKPPSFVRIYSDSRSVSKVDDAAAQRILGALATRKTKVNAAECDFSIERGSLESSREAWTLSSPKKQRWLRRVRENQVACFGDVAEVKVGIKTTADSVFIRSDWNEVPASFRPEDNVLLPLLTHHDAQRWTTNGSTVKRVLYPYDLTSVKRVVLSKKDFPRSFRYLEKNRTRLASRKYVSDSGRQWFEIWVPHRPVDWLAPKIVWPDISEQPRFFLDETGAIVNGDCYWIKLRTGVDSDWLYLMLAIANSNIATQFYDTVFHNKLYAGRRRFMTQYVKQFPLPDLDASKEIIALVKRQLKSPQVDQEQRLESLVQASFSHSD